MLSFSRYFVHRKILIIFIIFAFLTGKSQLTKPVVALKIERKRRRFPFLRKDAVFLSFSPTETRMPAKKQSLLVNTNKAFAAS